MKDLHRCGCYYFAPFNQKYLWLAIKVTVGNANLNIVAVVLCSMLK